MPLSPTRSYSEGSSYYGIPKFCRGGCGVGIFVAVVCSHPLPWGETGKISESVTTFLTFTYFFKEMGKLEGRGAGLVPGDRKLEVRRAVCEKLPAPCCDAQWWVTYVFVRDS